MASTTTRQSKKVMRKIKDFQRRSVTSRSKRQTNQWRGRPVSCGVQYNSRTTYLRLD